MLHLLFDPLCGWCYGAAPALAALKQQSSLAWQLHPTGLFAQPQAMDAGMAQYFWSNDQRIGQMTGQVFSQQYKDQILGDLSAPFDSSDATLAFYLISRQVPEQALDVLHRVQQLRYVGGQQTRDGLASLAAAFGIDRDQLIQDFAAGWPDELHTTTRNAQQLMTDHGLRGVPTLLLQKDQQLSVVPSSLLYKDAQALIDFVAQH
jgi:putative protein-disulfide isomerase